MKTPNYPVLRQKAREMRILGATLPELVKEIGLPRGTIYHWIRGIELSGDGLARVAAIKTAASKQGQLRASEVLKEKYANVRALARQKGRDEAVGAPLHVMGCMLFWAEGNKSINQVRFTNTDSSMIETFNGFLLSEMGVNPGKIRYGCIVHDGFGNYTQDECAEFWSNKLGVSKDRIETSFSADKREFKRRYNKHPAGIFAIRVYDVCVVQRIYGSIEKYIGKRLKIGF